MLNNFLRDLAGSHFYAHVVNEARTASAKLSILLNECHKALSNPMFIEETLVFQQTLQSALEQVLYPEAFEIAYQEAVLHYQERQAVLLALSVHLNPSVQAA